MSHAAHMTPTHHVKVLSVTFKVHTRSMDLADEIDRYDRYSLHPGP